MKAAFVVEPLGPNHDRTGFDCGVDALDRYFRQLAGQDVKRRVTACFVAREIATDIVAGYYTLAAGAVRLTELPEAAVKRLPRYPSVPVAWLERLAVGLQYRGRSLGGSLLWDAMERARKSEIAVFAMVVDAKDDCAARFYHHHGFVEFGGSQRTLMLPL